MSDLTLSDISVYPLKGASACHPDVWALTSSGLDVDRRWMLVDGSGRCVTQLSHRRIALIQTHLEPTAVRFEAPGLEDVCCSLAPAEGAARMAVSMEGGEPGWASTVDRALDGWFSEAIGEGCRLVRCPSEVERWVDGLDDEGAPLRFQKSFPLHLVSRASLDDLNERLQIQVAMDRFRPNLTVAGSEPHEDDGWKRIRVGASILQIGRACDHRCGVPNIDQQSGLSGVEPLKTLATYRRSSRGIYFGQNVTVERGAEVRVGDPVVVLERGEGLTRRTSTE